MISCTPRSVREAQSVIALADSMRAEGRVYEDSTQLAQAYQTLTDWQWFYADDFAHACYHYGRLLRAKDNPAAAMECFINATHSRTHDYHILGRVYSNMGSISHLAGEYALSYDMYERSSEMFLQDGDSIAYFYALNDMAFESAEQGEKEETLSLLNDIHNPDNGLTTLINLTKAVLYRNIKQYDSAMYCIDIMLKCNPESPAGITMKAQLFSIQNIKDSAIIYAKRVLSNPLSSYQNKFNALYILSYKDSTLNKEEIRDYASIREDIRYYQHEPEQDLSTKAVQLLQQDLTRKPDWRWLYAIIATLSLVGLIIGVYVSRKLKMRQLLSQQIDDLENRNNANIAQKKQQILERCSILNHSPNIKNDLCWNDYNQMCNIVNQHFSLLARKLQQSYHLSEREIRLCILVLIDGYTSKQMAELLYYAESGIRNLKSNTAKKLGTNGKEMRQFLINLTMK